MVDAHKTNFFILISVTILSIIVSISQSIADQNSLQINTPNENGDPPLIEAIIENNEERLIRLLQSKNLNINFANQKQSAYLAKFKLSYQFEAPIYIAAVLERNNLARRILADNRLDISYSDAKRIMSLVMRNSNFILFKLIYKHPSFQDTIVLGDLPVWDSSPSGQNFIDFFIEEKLINREQQAFDISNASSVDPFKNFGLDSIRDWNLGEPNYRTSEFEVRSELKVNLLSHIILEGSPEALKVQLDLTDKLNLNFHDSNGFSPIHYAALRGDIEIMQILLERTDLDIQNRTSQIIYFNSHKLAGGNISALEIAKYLGHWKIVVLLEKAEAVRASRLNLCMRYLGA